MSGDEMTDTNKTPTCDMHEALVSYLYNEATTEEARRVEDHTAQCAACKQELTSFERVRDHLQQWQLDDMPIVRVVTEPQRARRSAIDVLKELLGVMPVWAKAMGAVAAALLVFAVMGTSVSVGKGGVSLRADILRHEPTVKDAASVGNQKVDYVSADQLEQVRASLTAIVSQMIAESERQQKDELKAQLVNLESQFQNMRSADLAKIAMRVQEHHIKLRTLERDIDRREGSDLTDILFGELNARPERPRSGAQGGGE
jgi:putative zinc finger protein